MKTKRTRKSEKVLVIPGNSKVRRGDKVLVIAGNDKGKTGEVLSRTPSRILIQGINIRKKHMKRTQETQGGRIVEMEIPIHISNVTLCDKDGKRLKAKAEKEKKPAKAAKKTTRRPKAEVKNV